MDFSERFATNLIRLREEAGLSRDGLAVQSSIEGALIDSFETGQTLPRIKETIQLAGALGVPIEALIDGIEWQPEAGKFRHHRPLGDDSGIGRNLRQTRGGRNCLSVETADG